MAKKEILSRAAAGGAFEDLTGAGQKQKNTDPPNSYSTPTLPASLFS
jgi:hypothetical protein